MGTRTLILVLAALVCLTAPAVASEHDHDNDGDLRPEMDIGFVFDLRADLHDADRNADGSRRWTTRGFDLSTAELTVGAEAGRFGRVDFNAYFFEEGAEIHELFFTMVELPLGLTAQGGQFLASFGRWSRFHAHAMPFASEPRILHEYLGGRLMPTGLEMSWTAPVGPGVDIHGGVFNSIEGHSHHTDPAGSNEAISESNPPPGCHFHDGQLHCPDDEDLEEYYRSLFQDPEAPLPPGENKDLGDLAWLGRAHTTLEAGDQWSIELGASAIHQEAHRISQRFEGWDYAKTVAGLDATVFWRPDDHHDPRGLEVGVEYLRNREQFEVEVEADHEPTEVEGWIRETATRQGFFTWARYRLNDSWEFGPTFERFESRSGSVDVRSRLGASVTYALGHEQMLRLEYTHDDRGEFAPDVNQVILQFVGMIGHHEHDERH